MQKQKGFSTLIGIIIIIAVAVVATGGVFTYQYFGDKNLNDTNLNNQNQNQNNQATQPSITVTSPNGGEKWEVGKTYDITWTIPNKAIEFDKMGIEISRDTATTEKYFTATIVSDVSVNQGKFSWTIPLAIEKSKFDFYTNNTYKIRLYNREFPIDSSDNYFSIVAPADQTAGPALSGVEGWKTYTNTQYGFSIEYPSDWTTKILGKGETGDFSLMTLQIIKEASGSAYTSINVEADNFSLGTRDWINDVNFGQVRGSIACSGESKTNPNLLSKCEIYLVSKTDQKFYMVTKNPDLDSMTRQILSTFKFTPVK